MIIFVLFFVKISRNDPAPPSRKRMHSAPPNPKANTPLESTSSELQNEPLVKVWGQALGLRCSVKKTHNYVASKWPFFSLLCRSLSSRRVHDMGFLMVSSCSPRQDDFFTYFTF